MIAWQHLLWIVPLSFFAGGIVGIVLMAILVAARRHDNE